MTTLVCALEKSEIKLSRLGAPEEIYETKELLRPRKDL